MYNWSYNNLKPKDCLKILQKQCPEIILNAGFIYKIHNYAWVPSIQNYFVSLWEDTKCATLNSC